jgi:hypothetical protein
VLLESLPHPPDPIRAVFGRLLGRFGRAAPERQAASSRTPADALPNRSRRVCNFGEKAPRGPKWAGHAPGPASVQSLNPNHHFLILFIAVNQQRLQISCVFSMSGNFTAHIINSGLFA